MSDNLTALRKRLAPSVPLVLELEDDGGATFTRSFRLSWTFIASAEVEELTGLNLLTGEAWMNLTAYNLGVMLWGSVLAHHPEYGGRLPGETFEEFEKARKERQGTGLEAMLSYIDIGNMDKVNDAVWNAFFLSLPKDKREALEEAKRNILEQAKKGAIQASPLVKTETPSPSPSDGSESGPSPATISDSRTSNSESSPTPSSTLSLSAASSINVPTCSAPAPLPRPSPTVPPSAIPTGNL